MVAATCTPKPWRRREDSFCPYAKPLENGVLPQKDQVIDAVEALVGW